jgi:hypothetical protein
MQKHILLAITIAIDLVALVPQSSDARPRHRYRHRGGLAWTQRSAYGLYGAPPVAAIPGLRRGRTRPAFKDGDLVR